MNPFWNRSLACPEGVDAYGAKKAYAGEKRVAVIAYDNIGNRTSVTSVSSVVNYSPNNLNQYTQRQISDLINLRGSAETGATVTVKMGSSQSESVTRQDKYWHKQLTTTNDTEAQYPLIKVVGVAKNAATNGNDIVTIETGHVFVAKTPEQFTYDEDGNLLSDGRWEYTWNGENRLVSMETSTNVPASVPVTRLEFVYDYQGRRASKTVYSWSGTNWTEESESTFIYDSWNLVSETCDIQTLGLSTNLYVWGLDLSGSLQGAGGIGGLLFRSDGGTSSVSSVSYVFDANGNVSELLTDTGEIAAHYEYDPYGNTLVSEGELASDNVYRFSTKYTDTETKLLYYGFRYYSPSMGRWPSRDPVMEHGGKNLFAAMYNNPVCLVDADGRLVEVFTLKTVCASWVRIAGPITIPGSGGKWVTVYEDPYWSHVDSHNFSLPLHGIAGYKYDIEGEIFVKNRTQERPVLQQYLETRLCWKELCGQPMTLPAPWFEFQYTEPEPGTERRDQQNWRSHAWANIKKYNGPSDSWNVWKESDEDVESGWGKALDTSAFPQMAAWLSAIWNQIDSMQNQN